MQLELVIGLQTLAMVLCLININVRLGRIADELKDISQQIRFGREEKKR